MSRSRAYFIDTLRKTFDREIYDKIGQLSLEQGECEPPERERSDITEYKLKPLAPITLQQNPDLFSRHFSTMLGELPNAFCNHVQGTVRSNDNCWNGDSMGGYTSPSSLFDLQDQLCNPEVLPERLPCDEIPREMEMKCSREQYLMTDYAVTPSESTPGRVSGVDNNFYNTVWCLVTMVTMVTIWII